MLGYFPSWDVFLGNLDIRLWWVRNLRTRICYYFRIEILWIMLCYRPSYDFFLKSTRSLNLSFQHESLKWLHLCNTIWCTQKSIFGYSGVWTSFSIWNFHWRILIHEVESSFPLIFYLDELFVRRFSVLVRLVNNDLKSSLSLILIKEKYFLYLWL